MDTCSFLIMNLYKNRVVAFEGRENKHGIQATSGLLIPNNPLKPQYNQHKERMCNDDSRMHFTRCKNAKVKTTSFCIDISNYQTCLFVFHAYLVTASLFVIDIAFIY